MKRIFIVLSSFIIGTFCLNSGVWADPDDSKSNKELADYIADKLSPKILAVPTGFMGKADLGSQDKVCQAYFEDCFPKEAGTWRVFSKHTWDDPDNGIGIVKGSWCDYARSVNGAQNAQGDFKKSLSKYFDDHPDFRLSMVKWKANCYPQMSDNPSGNSAGTSTGQ